MTSYIGQNFLVNRNVADKIVKRFLPVEGNILEIGPGKGVLTDLLMKYRQENNKITAVELDTSLFYKLREKYTENFEILNRDILRVDLNRQFPDENEPLHVIGNVPYYISRELIDWVLTYHRKIKKGVFMMQKEFVNKLASGIESPDYNAQSVVFNGLYRLEKLFDVQPGSFSPQPRVKSTVFLFEMNAEGLGEGIEPSDFYRFVQLCFENRRKTLINNLSHAANPERLWEVFERYSIDHKVRAEQLTLEKFILVYRSCLVS